MTPRLFSIVLRCTGTGEWGLRFFVILFIIADSKTTIDCACIEVVILKLIHDGLRGMDG